jgi:transcriptional regulator with XRE-family HTH domain
MNLGTLIVAARKKKGWKQRDLVKNTGIVPSLISQIENDKKIPGIVTLQKICKALDLSVGELITKAEGLKTYKDGLLDSTRIIRNFLANVEWATYSDIQKLIEAHEEVGNNV